MTWPILAQTPSAGYAFARSLLVTAKPSSRPFPTDMLQQYLVIWLALLAAIAYGWPVDRAPDPFLASVPYLPGMIATIMFAIGWLLPRDELRQVARQWPSVLWGTAVQYVSMPLIAYGTARAFGFEGPLLAGLVIVGCVPGAMASNVLTLAARGNVSYSVSLTTSATLLSPLVVPFSLGLFLGRADVEYDPTQVAWNLMKQVVLPVLAGHLLGRAITRWRRPACLIAEALANLVIIWLIAVVVGQNRDRLAEIDPRLTAALLIINVAGYAAGYFGALAARLSEPMRRALALEVGMQNAGLGVVLANQLLSAQAAVPPALFAFGCMFTGAILARAWARVRPGDPASPSNADAAQPA